MSQQSSYPKGLPLQTPGLNDLLIVDDTLLMYTGHDRYLRVPQQVNGQLVHKIGMGAFHGVSSVENIVLDPGFTWIGRRAFMKCPALKTVVLPDSIAQVDADAFTDCPMLQEIRIIGLPIPHSEYDQYLASCSRLPDGTTLSRIPPAHPLIRQLLSSVKNLQPAAWLPPVLPCLFHEPVSAETIRAEHLLILRETVSAREDPPLLCEDQAVMQLIQTGILPASNADAELEHDRLIRQSIQLEPVPCCCFSLVNITGGDDAETCHADVRILIGRYYWPSVIPVSMDGKTYHIYRRHYMNIHEKRCYLCRDIAVYADMGLVTNLEESRRVYAKYILPALL